MKISFSPVKPADVAVLVVGVPESKTLSGAAKEVDKATGGLARKMVKAGRFSGKKGTFHVLTPSKGWDVVILAGLGKGKEFTDLDAQNLGGAAVKQLNGERAKAAAIVVDVPSGCKLSEAEMAANIAMGAKLGSYRFDKYLTKEKKEDKPTLTSLKVMSGVSGKARSAYADLSAVADGVLFTRDLVTEPANVIHPPSLAEACKTLKPLGVKVEVLGEDKMQKLGMNALLGVGQGSAHDSHLVVMRWDGGAKKDKPLAFVGKGVTFDTGGISIKPSGGMEEMKWDMGGAGVVIGLMKALAGRKAKVNAVGVVGLVENMPSATAQRPGDVVTSMSGQTIEVLNTDAEGRLVLADALWYTQDRFKPEIMIDLATLTGAIIVGLGTSRAGLFSNNDKLANRLFACGKATGEEVWRLPLAEVYDKQINSPIADMQNIGADREAGSITAAQFLQRFVNDVPWAHLDIAGVAWSKKDKDITPKGGTGYGVRLLDRLVSEYYE